MSDMTISHYMFIDENKIRNASKKSMPSLRKFRRGDGNLGNSTVQKIIGFVIVAALLSGVAMLIWTIIDGAVDYGTTLENRQSVKKSEYIQVIFKPKQPEQPTSK